MEDYFPEGTRLTGDSEADFSTLLEMIDRDQLDELFANLITARDFDTVETIIMQLDKPDINPQDKALLLLAEGQCAMETDDFPKAHEKLASSERIAAAHGEWDRAMVCTLYQAVVCNVTDDLAKALDVQQRFNHYSEQLAVTNGSIHTGATVQYEEIINTIVEGLKT